MGEVRPVGRSERLDQFDLHPGKAGGVSRQEGRQDALDHLWRGRDLQDAGVSAPEQVNPLAQRTHLAQDAAEVSDHCLGDGGQHEPAPHAIEEPDAQLLLEVTDVPRKGGLADAQVLGGPRHRAQLGDGDDGAQAPQVHVGRLSPIGMNAQKTYVLDLRVAWVVSSRTRGRRETDGRGGGTHNQHTSSSNIPSPPPGRDG